MTILLAIDPGPTHSAYVLFHEERQSLLEFDKVSNTEMLDRLHCGNADHLAIEMIASYGMAVGAEVFETCVVIGRLIQAWTATKGDHTRVYRREVKLHLCGSPRAKDANVRQALVDRYGGKSAAIGKKASPGPLYGVSADAWAALAVAVTAADMRARGTLARGAA